ncbi:MAG TPA: hypothetical protein VIP70_04145 [Nitrososphaeraceae archaeon]
MGISYTYDRAKGTGTDVRGKWILSTQLVIGEEPYLSGLDETIPYYKEMVSMVEFGRQRPSVEEYPQVAEHIRQVIEDVYYGLKDPKQALDKAAAKSAEVLGW